MTDNSLTEQKNARHPTTTDLCVPREEEELLTKNKGASRRIKKIRRPQRHYTKERCSKEERTRGGKTKKGAEISPSEADKNSRKRRKKHAGGGARMEKRRRRSSRRLKGAPLLHGGGKGPFGWGFSPEEEGGQRRGIDWNNKVWWGAGQPKVHRNGQHKGEFVGAEKEPWGGPESRQEGTI